MGGSKCSPVEQALDQTRSPGSAGEIGTRRIGGIDQLATGIPDGDGAIRDLKHRKIVSRISRHDHPIPWDS